CHPHLAVVLLVHGEIGEAVVEGRSWIDELVDRGRTKRCRSLTHQPASNRDGPQLEQAGRSRAGPVRADPCGNFGAREVGEPKGKTVRGSLGITTKRIGQWECPFPLSELP